MNITAPIRAIARQSPDPAAILRADGSAITYGALDQAIDRMAARALALGLRAGDVAGLPIAPPHETTALVLALGLARIGVSSAAPSLPRDQMSLLFGPTAGPGQVRFDAAWLTEPLSGAAPPMHDDPATLCRIFASSGTTGTPKHIPVSHQVMTRRVYSRWLSLGGAPKRRMIGVGLGIGWGFATVLVTLWNGGTIVLFDPATAAATMRRQRVNVVIASPMSLRAMLDSLPPGDPPPPDLEAIEVGGATVPPPLRQAAAQRLCPNVILHIGAAEAGGTASGRIGAEAGRPDAVGRVWPDVEMQAVDANHNPLPPGTQGVLRVRSPMVAPGYYRDPAATRASFRDGWFYPGDIGTVWPDGTLCLNGRSAELINAGGDKINPRIIERALLRMPGVTDAAAFGVPDAMGLDHVWAAIVAEVSIQQAALYAHCDKLIPGVPVETILQLEALPRNENGKISRDALVALGLRMTGQRVRS